MRQTASQGTKCALSEEEEGKDVGYSSARVIRQTLVWGPGCLLIAFVVKQFYTCEDIKVHARVSIMQDAATAGGMVMGLCKEFCKFVFATIPK